MFSPLLKEKIWDRAGVFLSAACALHCLAMALLPMFLPSLVKSSCCHDCSSGPNFHILVLPVVLGIGILAFRKPCCSRCPSALWKLIAGMTLLASPHFFAGLAPYEMYLTVTGAFLVGSAHLQNFRARQQA